MTCKLVIFNGANIAIMDQLDLFDRFSTFNILVTFSSAARAQRGDKKWGNWVDGEIFLYRAYIWAI
jgi:hypothetical protein